LPDTPDEAPSAKPVQPELLPVPPSALTDDAEHEHGKPDHLKDQSEA
jgi:hypothetical protein